MRNERLIPRRERGTIATLVAMAQLASEGLGSPLLDLFPVDDLDATIRSVWFYVDDGEVETLSSIGHMEREFNGVVADRGGGRLLAKPPGTIAGDCDEAATLAAAVLLRARLNGDRRIGPITLLGARPAQDQEFRHVFLIFRFNGTHVRVDPTAPATADYSLFELIPFTF